MANHRHLYVLPLERRRDGRIDTVILHAGGAEIGTEEMNAVLRLRYLNMFDSAAANWDNEDAREHIRVTAVQWGRVDKLRTCEFATTVVSSTPFVPTRFWKPGRGEFTDFMEANIREECSRHYLPDPVHVRPAERMASRYVEARFRRNRKEDSPRPGYRVEIEFAEPVRVPFSIGYAAHFGLGQFVRSAA